MAKTSPSAERLQHLAALVRQQRTSLGWNVTQAWQEVGLTYTTYMRVEDGNTVRDSTYSKIEDTFEWRRGSCHAVLQGADSVTTIDGVEVRLGAQLLKSPLHDLKGELRRAVEDSMFSVAPDLTVAEARAIADGASGNVVKILREHGLIADSTENDQD